MGNRNIIFFSSLAVLLLGSVAVFLYGKFINQENPGGKEEVNIQSEQRNLTQGSEPTNPDSEYYRGPSSKQINTVAYKDGKFYPTQLNVVKNHDSGCFVIVINANSSPLLVGFDKNFTQYPEILPNDSMVFDARFRERKIIFYNQKNTGEQFSLQLEKDCLLN